MRSATAMKWGSIILPIAAAVLLVGCATVPAGPSVMVLPGTAKSFEQFQTDDVVCRQWAAQQTGTTTERASTESTVGGAAIGTALGAAAGAALGAASGHPGTGAAVGAGVGLLGGTAVGAGSAQGATTSLQRRYDNAYMQCMYTKGNEIPVAGGSRSAYGTYRQPAYTLPPGVPPPPPGSPPPPPSGPSQ